MRLSAGRQQLGDAVQALCFMAGANSIFYGDKLLVTGNPDVTADEQLLAKLGLRGHRTTQTAAPGEGREEGAGCSCNGSC